jgi:mannosyl-3-phosphoglycerate phosphatase family protein
MSRGVPNTPDDAALGSNGVSNRILCGSGREQPAILVFTDLDGTLLDSANYSFEPARSALQLLKDLGVPLIICSSKTRLEIERYRRRLANPDPFIAENGGGIFIPKGYFPIEVVSPEMRTERRDDYDVFVLGAAYPDLRHALERLRRQGNRVKGFGDMTPEEVAEITGLTLEEAAMAKERDFDEPFVLEKETDVGVLRESIERLGFRSTKGALYHILGESDKGKAVSILSSLYRRALGSVVTIALGDSPNDFSMLEKVDYPVLVQKPDGSHDPAISLPNLIQADGVGPLGWNKAITSLLRQIALKR